MIRHLRIDFVSDVSCPWCAIGLAGLTRALSQLRNEMDAKVNFHPFELNPAMPRGGQNFAEHVRQKYGSTLDQMAANQKALIARAADVGFNMAITTDSRIYNTFDAHRLLYWGAIAGRQMELKQILFDFNFTENRAVDDPQVLVDAAVAAKLDMAEARAVVGTDRYATEVHVQMDRWRSTGITSVPTMVINGEHRVTGALSVEDIKTILREVAA